MFLLINFIHKNQVDPLNESSNISKFAKEGKRLNYTLKLIIHATWFKIVLAKSLQRIKKILEKSFHSPTKKCLAHGELQHTQNI